MQQFFHQYQLPILNKVTFGFTYNWSSLSLAVELHKPLLLLYYYYMNPNKKIDGFKNRVRRHCRHCRWLKMFQLRQIKPYIFPWEKQESHPFGDGFDLGKDESSLGKKHRKYLKRWAPTSCKWSFFSHINGHGPL